MQRTVVWVRLEPRSSECGTSKTVKARFCCWLSGKRPEVFPLRSETGMRLVM